MKRLNGWQRIGIILSVLWMVGGWFWTRDMVVDELSKAPTQRLAEKCWK